MGNIVINSLEIVYLWKHHFNPNIQILKVEKVIRTHNWYAFKKMLKWQKTQKLEYFPSVADVYINGKLYGQLVISEETFGLITRSDYEGG